MPPQASAAMAAFFERTSSGDEFENGFGFASELGEEQREGCFVDFQEALPAPAPPPFYHVPSDAAAAAAAKASAWAAGVPLRSAALLSSAQLDALWAAVRSAATAFSPATAGGESSPSSSSDDDPLSCRESSREQSPAAAAATALHLHSRNHSRRKVLTYAAYRRAAEAAARGGAGPAAAALLTARAFLRLAGSFSPFSSSSVPSASSSLSPSPSVVIDAESLCDYLGQRAGQLQMHVHLSCFDAGGGSGWLTEAGAAAFVRATLPQLARSGCCGESDAFEGRLSLEDHAAIAARKLVFFHGRNIGSCSSSSPSSSSSSSSSGGGGGGKRLRIRDVLAGRALAELLELAAPAPDAAASASSNDDDIHRQTASSPPGGPATNWFSAASAAAAAAAFASGAAAGVEAAAAAGVDLSEARVSFHSRTDSESPSFFFTSAAEAASSGALGIPAAALCELGDGTLSPLFAARLVEEKGDARALVAEFCSSSADSSPEEAEGSCSCIGSSDENENEEEDEEENEEEEGDAMNVDGQQDNSRRRRRRRRNPKKQQTPPSLRATAGLSLPSFLDFLLAWSDRNDPKSVSWLWPALDLRGRGQLSRPDVERLFEPVRKLWVERGQYDALQAQDVASEVFDIVVPDRPGFDQCITKADLCRCPMAGIVIGLLCDVGCFYEHDSRELQLQQAALGTGEEEEEEEEEDAAADGDFGEQEEEGRESQQKQGDLEVLDESNLERSSSAAAAAVDGSLETAAAA